MNSNIVFSMKSYSSDTFIDFAKIILFELLLWENEYESNIYRETSTL